MADYSTLNEKQQQAVFQTEGPVLVLAGAGSGKTRAITHRIAYLIEEMGVNPYHIMAITFTNKAAREMKERVDALVSYGSEAVWVATFHSTCVRILRQHIERIGYDRNFTIYDTDDQKNLIKQCYKKLQIDPKNFPEKTTLSEISKAKDEFLTPADYRREHENDFRRLKIADLYQEYQKELQANNALDFDDLLFKTVELFQFHPDVLEQYQERFRYIMVDEYQDTNTIQFMFVNMLARKYRNLCVVGDDDQSIYKFRGANILNILNFEQQFPDAAVIKLEQNYRSTKNILEAANCVIANNHGRKAKTLWTANEEGEKISLAQYESEYDEADGVTRQIQNVVSESGASYADCAILYRTNAQSRVLEEKLLMRSIPYRIFGGVNFYQRKEIKDLISYLKVVFNGVDDMAVRRIINVPKRGIGATTLDKVAVYAEERNIDFMQALFEAEEIPGIKKAAEKIKTFTDLIQELRAIAATPSEGFLEHLYEQLLEKTGYRQALVDEKTEESMARVENIDELQSKIATYESEAELPSLGGLLEEIALVADIDNLDDERECVVLMTLHSAKGLEFPYVFLTGLEDGLFPGMMSILAEGEEELEEERRLCYVGITRAERGLYISAARRRMVRGESRYSKLSRFVEEIPEELLQGTAKMRMAKPDVLAQAKSTVQQRMGSFGKPFAHSYQSRSFASNAPIQIDYAVGDTVRHIKFGQGVVTEIVAGGRDYEVTVDFAKVGVKKMFASFAKLKKL
ncbi:MAG: DNA helicase PcrA [Lachnospiraceae bacterium]